MKLNLFIISFLISLLSYENATGQARSSLIIGKWQFEKFISEDSTQVTEEIENESKGVIIEFKEAGDFITKKSTDKHTLTLAEGKYKISPDGKSLVQAGNSFPLLMLNSDLLMVRAMPNLVMKFKRISGIVLPENSNNHCVIKGLVVHKENNEAIPGTSLQLMKENVGVSADAGGHFALNAACIPGDTLIISSIGYKTEKIAVAKLSADNLFQLLPLGKELSTVVVKGNKEEQIILNKNNNSSFQTYISEGFVSEIAQSYFLPYTNYRIKAVEVCKQKGNAMFRLKLYEFDTLYNKPGKLLADSLINSSKKKVYIDLTNYNVLLTQNKFFVAIEWLFMPENRFQEKWRISGKKIVKTWYHPCLCMNTNLKRNYPEGDVESWFHRSDKKWVKFDDFLFLIAVQVEEAPSPL